MNAMNEQKAFEFVYERLKQYPMFMGKFDAKNGSKPFIYGIETIMEYIACIAGKEEEYTRDWSENFEESLRKAENNV